MGSRLDALVLDVCGSDDHPLAVRLRAWLAGSRAFGPFVEANLSKVRRKVRQASGMEELADVAAELAVAAWLLRERRWTLEYEPLAATGGRGPDFRVAAPDGTGAFYVEVARLRPAREGIGSPLPVRLARVLADKVGQLPAGAVNVLAVALPAGEAGRDLLTGALHLLDEAAAGLQPGLDGRAFARGRFRLGAVLLAHLEGEPQTELAALPGARHPIPTELARRVRALP
ncbi:hypothetical protein [Deinococcus sp. KSM4-11]|uniref:hypothetical protein n=1 Tax=Deinococcus sp. KSM4-11 TaxID=2568654 RepID=UPI001454C93C|nr:hypothetical protein [Deinococcus sp. KSM4-11]